MTHVLQRQLGYQRPLGKQTIRCNTGARTSIGLRSHVTLDRQVNVAGSRAVCQRVIAQLPTRTLSEISASADGPARRAAPPSCTAERSVDKLVTIVGRSKHA